jgi:hypothetical protein
LLGLFKIKSLLIGMFLASPPVAAWMLHASEPIPHTTASQSVTPSPSTEAVQIPVEIFAKGSASKWVYVAVPTQAVPEPGITLLLPLASLLLLRRRRSGGK